MTEDNKRKISQSSEKDALVRNDRPSVIGIIISAGLSSRMGKFKPLLDYRAKSFLVNIVDKLLTVCNSVIIITGYNSKEIGKSILGKYDERVECIFNADYKKGMFTSLKKGIENTSKANWILFHQVDQPNLPKKFYTEYSNEIDEEFDWIQPRFNNQNGHPILLGKNIIKKIIEAENDTNLRILSHNSDVKKKFWNCDYPETLTDIDSPTDYVKLKRE